MRPGETFVYEFTPRDAGTFWFHPHVRASEQVERGLYGVLVVEDPQPAPYSRDLVWVVDDWVLRDGAIYPEFNTRHDLAMDGGNAITINGRTDTAVSGQPGERLRVRMLDSSNGRVYTPDFGELDAKLIAVDGMYLREPIAARDFELAPGNRIDVDGTFDKSSAAPFTITDRCIAQRPNVLARFEVAGALVESPQSRLSRTRRSHCGQRASMLRSRIRSGSPSWPLPASRARSFVAIQMSKPSA